MRWKINFRYLYINTKHKTMSKEMRKYIDTFKKFSLNENDGYTDKERKIIKLRELENELFSSTIKELIDSNNIDEMNKFLDYIESKNIWLSSNQFIHRKIYELKDKNVEQKDISIDYDDIDRKIDIFKKTGG